MNIIQYAIAFSFVFMLGAVIGKAFGYKQAFEELVNGSIHLTINNPKVNYIKK